MQIFRVFLYLFLFFRDFFYRDKNSTTTKAGNWKFGDMISLYMKLCTCIFEGAALRDLEQTSQKLVTTMFNK